MEISNVNHLQELFGPKPLNMIPGGQVASKPFISKRDLAIGGVCLGLGIVAGCILYHSFRDDK